MRKLFSGASALIAAAAIMAPGAAAAQSGYVGATYSSTDIDVAADEVESWGVEGSVFFPTSGAVGFQLDGAFTDADEGDGAFGLTGHVFTRNDDYLFGGFVGAVDGDDSTTVAGGLELARYFNRWTLNGSLAIGNNDDLEADASGANIGASFFPVDAVRLDVNYSYIHVDVDGLGADNVNSYGLGAEYQLSALPISFSAGWSHAELDESDVEAQTWTVGLRYNFGSESLFARDRSGASQANRTAFSSAFALLP